MWHFNHGEGRKKVCSIRRVLVILEVSLLKAVDLRLIKVGGCTCIYVWVNPG